MIDPQPGDHGTNVYELVELIIDAWADKGLVRLADCEDGCDEFADDTEVVFNAALAAAGVIATSPAVSTPDAELRERLRAEAIRHGERATEEFGRAEELMAEVERLTGELAERTRDLRAGRDLALWLHAEQTWRYNVVLRDCAEAQTAEDVAIEEGRGYLTRSRELASQLAALRAQQQDMVRLPADARGEIERLLTANVGKPAGGVAHKVMLLLTDDWRASPASTEAEGKRS